MHYCLHTIRNFWGNPFGVLKIDADKHCVQKDGFHESDGVFLADIAILQVA